VFAWGVSAALPGAPFWLSAALMLAGLVVTLRVTRAG
jgi:hypothetical protein